MSVAKATVPGSFEEKIAREGVYTYTQWPTICNMCACAGVPVYEWGKCTPPTHLLATPQERIYPYLIDFVEENDGIWGRRREGKDTGIVEEGEKTTCRCQWFVNIAQRRDTIPHGGREVRWRGFRKIAYSLGHKCNEELQ